MESRRFFVLSGIFMCLTYLHKLTIQLNIIANLIIKEYCAFLTFFGVFAPLFIIFFYLCKDFGKAS